LTADLEAEKSMKDLIEKQKNRLKQKVDELETRLKTESDARDEMESEARKAKLDLRRMERELKAAVEDRDMLVRCRLHLSIIDPQGHFCNVFVVLIK
jgi:chromosome segregation ATPase